MSPLVRLLDREDVLDLHTFVTRARALEAGGAVRLATAGDVLALTVCVVPGTGLLGDGTILGLRAWRLVEPAGAEVDVVVALESIAERLARMNRGAATALAVPPAQVRAVWAATSPPRSGWEPLGEVRGATLATAAADGMAEITSGAPAGSGAQAVADLRRRVWGRPMVGVDAPAGLAFGAHALGFAGPARLFAHGPWRRLATPAGQVISR